VQLYLLPVLVSLCVLSVFLRLLHVLLLHLLDRLMQQTFLLQLLLLSHQLLLLLLK